MYSKTPDAVMSVQWHITSRCGKRCRHCYMYESERYMQELENEISLENICRILDDISEFERKYNFRIRDFFITGGDPLIREDFRNIISELNKREKVTVQNI